MTVDRLDTKCLLTPGDFEPTQSDLKVVGAFNPAAAAFEDDVMLLVRVAEVPVDQHDNCRHSPRWNGQRIEIDRFDCDWSDVDMRVFRTERKTQARLTFTSHLRAIRLRGGDQVDADAIVNAVRFDPVEPWEKYGVEDPRITYLDGRYWITYVAVAERGPCTALASTTDFVAYQRQGIIFPVENKDVVLFPEKIGGRYMAMHRPVSGFAHPAMWLASSDNLTDWGRHTLLQLDPAQWSQGRVGGGCPPIKTDHGWLVIYHGNDHSPKNKSGEVGSYFGAAMLLDMEDPSRVIARSPEPLFRPAETFEREGFVPNVVFPTGMVERDDEFLIYYGAGDEAVGLTRWSRQAIIDSLQAV